MEPAAYRTLLESLGADPRTLERAPDARIELGASHDALQLPPEARMDIHLRELLGVGGMGAVHLAEQVALRRDVAAKVPLQTGSDHVRRAILREAWITGALEHPNIVPIHDVVTLPNGEPCVLMKRIEGVSWLECIDDPTLMPRGGGSERPMERAVEIALSLCDALELAHNRNVLHRDVKPANVMLGRYGEVYLVDWGIAVAYDDPEVSASKAPEAGPGVSGTPVYMAPEMARGDAGALGPWTDIYLVGATLHHVLTGRPPHDGGNAFESLLKATTSVPLAYPDLPTELAAILHRAMAADPRRRYRTAAALREELRLFLAHRASRDLTEVAGDRLAEADALESGDPARGGRLTEARAGYRQALASWPGNAEAREGFHRATVRLAEEELARDNLGAAEALLGDLERPPPSLADRVAALRERIETQRDEVRSLRRQGVDRDLSLGARGRALAALLFGVACLVNLSLLHVWRGHPSHWTGTQFVFDATLSVVLSAGVLGIFRSSFLKNRANRNVAILLVFSTVAVLVERALVAGAEVSFTPVIALEHFVYAAGFGGMALAADYRIFAVSLAFAAGGVLGLLLPQWVLLASAASVAGGLWALAWVWWPRGRDGPGEGGGSPR